MGQILRGSATTTEAVRRVIQNNQESLRPLAKRYGINQKTVGTFRRHTLLPLDDCLYALQPTIAHLTRSSRHRCLQRHGIFHLPEVEGDKPAKKGSSKNFRISSFRPSPEWQHGMRFFEVPRIRC